MIFLTGVVLGLHVICVSLASVGPLLAAWCDVGRGRTTPAAPVAGRFIASVALWGLVIGSLLGLLLGYLGWSDSFRVALKLLRRKLEWGGVEWLFSLALLIVVAVWWRKQAAPGTGGRWIRALLGVLAGTNLLYHFTFLFFILEQVERYPVADSIDPAAFREYMVQGRTLAHVAHFTLAAIVLCGTAWIYAAWRYRDEASSGAEGTTAKHLATWGGRVAAVPAVLQLPVGFWLVFEIPKREQQAMMGHDMIVTVAFMLAVVLSLWMMHLLASSALGKASPKRWRITVIVVLVVVLLMSFVGESLQRRESADQVVTRIAFGPATEMPPVILDVGQSDQKARFRFNVLDLRAS